MRKTASFELNFGRRKLQLFWLKRTILCSFEICSYLVHEKTSCREIEPASSRTERYAQPPH